MLSANTENLRRCFSTLNILGKGDAPPKCRIKDHRASVNYPMDIDTTTMQAYTSPDESRNTPVKSRDRHHHSGSNHPLTIGSSLSKESLSTVDATPLYNSQPQQPSKNRFNLQSCANINTNDKSIDSSGAPANNNVVFPHRLLSYVQVSFNIILLLVLIWSIATFVKAIRDDIESKIQIHAMELMDKVSACARDYRENRCDPKDRVPALEKVCNEWEICMNQDSAIIAKRSKLSAQTVGEVVNAFLEQLTWKSFSLLAASFFTVFIGSNCALSMAYNMRCRY